MSRDRLAGALLERALHLYSRRLWLTFENDHCVVLRIPDEPHDVVASIMGAGGQEYGLSILLGESAVEQTVLGHASVGVDRALVEQGHRLGYSVGPLGVIPHDLRRVQEAAGVSGRRETLTPWFLAKPPGGRTRNPNRREQRLILYATNAILAALDQGDFRPVSLDTGRILCLDVSGTPFEPAVSGARFRTLEVPHAEPDFAEEGTEAQALAALEQLRELRELERTDARWVVGLHEVPAHLRSGDPTVRAVVIADRDGDRLVAASIVSDHPVEKAFAVVIAAMLGENAEGWRGLPRSVRLTNGDLLRLLEASLGGLDVRLELVPRDDLLDALASRFASYLEEQGDGAVEPEDEDLFAYATWRRLDDGVTRTLLAELERAGRSADRARQAYFGELRPGSLEPFGEAPAIAFLDWITLDHRPTRRSKTIAEIALARRDALTGHEADLLRARAAASPSFYLIEGVETGEGLTLIDTLSGDRVVVADRALSLTIPVGLTVTARVYAAGPFHFISVAGPLLPSHVVVHATAFLEELGLAWSEGAPDRPELFGRLWGWALYGEEADAGPRLANAHGEELVHMELAYDVADPDALLALLAGRDDIDADADDGRMRWLLRAPDGWVGDMVVGGTLELIGQELLAEVNSASRAQALRGWLDDLPGVTFRNLRERPWTESSADAELPTLGAELPADEVIDAIRAMMDEHHRRWLDMPIPALGHQTPRAACASAGGRRQVRQLILTMSPARGPGGLTIDPPRERLLSELGLD